MRATAALILAVLAAAGALAAPPAFEAAVAALRCPGACYDPVVAGDGAGMVAVTASGAGSLAVSSDDGASFDGVPAPPLPVAGAEVSREDDSVSVHAGRIWWSALVTGATADRKNAVLGVHVAVSPDGGATWPVNAHLPLPRLESFTLVRHWVVVQDAQTAYVAYGEGAGGIWVARTVDGGAHWTPFAEALPVDDRSGVETMGNPVVPRPGHLVVPYVAAAPTSALSYDLHVLVSEDGGRTFRNALVEGLRSGSEHPYFPSAATVEDTVVLARKDPDGRIRVSSSRDLVSWSAAETVGGPAEGSPWVLARADGVDVAWIEDGSVVLARAAWASLAAPERYELASVEAGRTDFPTLAPGRDGVLAVYLGPKDTLYVAQERSATSAPAAASLAPSPGDLLAAATTTTLAWLAGLVAVAALVAGGRSAARWLAPFLLLGVRGDRFRERLRDEVARNPGLTTTAFARVLGVSKSGLHHHLRRAEEDGLVRSVRVGRHRILLPPGASEDLLRPLAVPGTRRVAEAIMLGPGRHEAAIADALGLARSTVHHHLTRLLEAGLVRVERGVVVRCWPTHALEGALRPTRAP